MKQKNDTTSATKETSIPGLKIRGKTITIAGAKKEKSKWKQKTRKAGKYQTTINKALAKSAEALDAAVEVQTIVESMNDKGRKLFSALTMGMDEAEAVYTAGLEEFYIFPHMRKVVTIGGEILPIQNISLLMIKKGLIQPDNLRKMNEVAAHAMQIAGRSSDYSVYVRDINDAFKIVAPEAFKVINEVMMDPFEKGQTRINAAEAVLDRGGYQVKEQATPQEMPAQVNILISDKPYGTVEVITGKGKDDHKE